MKKTRERGRGNIPGKIYPIKYRGDSNSAHSTLPTDLLEELGHPEQLAWTIRDGRLVGLTPEQFRGEYP